MDYKNKKVLVTGSSGYIGSVLTRKLKALGAAVTASGPFSDQEVIFHLAAQTSEKIARMDVAKDWTVNCEPFQKMLEACQRSACQPHIVFASTATLDTAEPLLTYYDVHKRCNEDYLGLATRSENLSGIVLRLANVYGPSVAVSRPGRGVLNWMAEKALRDHELTIFGTGDWLRDFVYIEDVVDAFLQAGIKPPSQNRFAIHTVCTGMGTPFKNAVQMLAEMIETATDEKVRIHFESNAPLTPVETRSYMGNAMPIQKALGWVAQTKLREGLELLVSSKLGGVEREALGHSPRL